MNELIKLLIEWINSSKMAKEGLLLLGALAVIFSIFEYLLKNPFAVHILDDYRFHASAIALISFWVSSL